MDKWDEVLQIHMDQKGWDLMDLARALGDKIPLEYLQDVISGKKVCSVYLAEELCKVLDIDKNNGIREWQHKQFFHDNRRGILCLPRELKTVLTHWLDLSEDQQQMIATMVEEMAQSNCDV